MNINEMSFDQFMSEYDFSNFFSQASLLKEVMDLIENKIPKKDIIEKFGVELYLDAKEQIKAEKEMKVE